MLNSEFRRVSSFTNFSQNCVYIFQNLSIIFYVIFSFIENRKDIFFSHGKTGGDHFSCLSLPSFMVLYTLFLLGTIQIFSSKEISPLVPKWDMGEAQRQSFSSPMQQHGLVASHWVSKVHLPPSVMTGLHSPTQLFFCGISQIPRNCPYFT